MIVGTALNLAGTFDAGERTATVGVDQAALSVRHAGRVGAITGLAGQSVTTDVAGISTRQPECAARLPADADPCSIDVAFLAWIAVAVALAFAGIGRLDAPDAAGALDAFLIESAVRIGSARRRRAHAIRALARAAARVVNTRHTGAAAFAGAA